MTDATVRLRATAICRTFPPFTPIKEDFMDNRSRARSHSRKRSAAATHPVVGDARCYPIRPIISKSSLRAAASPQMRIVPSP